jgi:hypothetical protein
MADANPNAQPTKNSSLPQLQSSRTPVRMEAQSRATVTMLLSRLAIHYYRPDFTEGQAKCLIQDMLEDLDTFSVREVELAIKTYRQNAENRFFPRGADLRKIILDWRGPAVQRLPKHTAYPRPERPATKSVGQVLRDNGLEASARSWEEWKDFRARKGGAA